MKREKKKEEKSDKCVPIKCSIKGKAQFETIHGNLTVDDKYLAEKVIGSGAYGIVVSAEDKQSKKKSKVAIKWIHKAFEDAIDAKRVLREIKILSK